MKCLHSILAPCLFTGFLLLGCNSEPAPDVDSTSAGPTSTSSNSSTSQATQSQAPKVTSKIYPGNKPPFIRSVKIVPNPITLDQPIYAVIDAVDPEGGGVTFEHQWKANGRDLEEETNPHLSPQAISRGDRVSLQVTPLDAQSRGASFDSEEVTVGNTPPEVTELTFEPFPARVGQRLTPKVQVRDLDQDEVSLSYRWLVNDRTQSEGSPHPLDLKEAHRGDTIVLEIIPRDPTEVGKLFTSRPITVANSLPRITTSPPTEIHDGQYRYAVGAEDPDGDSLTFGLQNPPSGMTIDARTGKLQWQLTPEVKGNHTIMITVSDGQGEEPVSQEFELTLNK